MNKAQLRLDCEALERKHPGARLVAFDATCTAEEACVVHGIAWVDELMTRWEDEDDDDE